MTRELAELITMVLTAILLAYASYDYGYRRVYEEYRKWLMEKFYGKDEE